MNLETTKRLIEHGKRLKEILLARWETNEEYMDALETYRTICEHMYSVIVKENSEDSDSARLFKSEVIDNIPNCQFLN